MRTWQRGLATAAVVLLAVGCSGDDDPRGEPAPTPSSSSVSTPGVSPSPTAPIPTATYSRSPVVIRPSPGALVTFDWQAPEALTVNGWTLRDCPGDAPLVCVEQDGVAAGVVEVLSYPVASLPADVSGAYRRGDVPAALRAHADGYLRDVRADRSRGCGGGYDLRPTSTELLKAGGTDVVRYGFTARTAGGQPSEATTQYAGFRGDRLVILNAAAYDEGGCLAVEGDSFSTAELGGFVPVLDTVVRTARFPQPS